MLLLLAVFAFSLYSCKDDEDEFTFYNTYIEGYIKDYHTGEPVSGVVFDAYYFNEYSGDQWLAPDPYPAKEVAVSNSQGYYKIRVPKAWKPKDGAKFNDIVKIRVTRRDVENYSFTSTQGPFSKDYSYEEEGLKTRNKREDIRPVSYGYLKVILPKTSNQNWSIWGNYEQETYEIPFFKHKFISSGEYNETMNYLFFKVCAFEGEIGCGDFPGIRRYFAMENPRDTVIINVEQ